MASCAKPGEQHHSQCRSFWSASTALALTVLFVFSCATRQSLVSPEHGSVKSEAPDTGWLLPEEERRLPMLQNASGGGVAQFTVLVPSDGVAALRVQAEQTTGELVPAKSLSLEAQKQPFRTRPEWTLAKVRIDGLSPKKSYVLKISSGDRLLDSRNFSVPDTADGQISFAYGTCMNDESPYKAAARALADSLASERPDFLIIAGDAVYVDSWERWENEPKGTRPTFDEGNGINDFELRYIETWSRLPLYRMETLIPTLSVWDDHDYGTNDGDANFTFKDVSLSVHELFYGASRIRGVYEEPFSSDGGRRARKDLNRASVYRTDGHTFLLADNRTHRVFESHGEWLADFPGDKLTDYATHYAAHTGSGRLRAARKQDSIFGFEQHKWISAVISERPRGPLWFISGNQFFGNHHTKETFSSRNPNSLYRMIQELFQSGRPFTILSGDIHYTEVSGYQLKSPQQSPPTDDAGNTAGARDVGVAADVNSAAATNTSYDVLEVSVSPFHSTIKTDTVNSGLLERNKNANRLRCDSSTPAQCRVAQKPEDFDLGLSGHNFALIRTVSSDSQNPTFSLTLQSLLQPEFRKEALLQMPNRSRPRAK